jgi:hypothetical protein
VIEEKEMNDVDMSGKINNHATVEDADVNDVQHIDDNEEKSINVVDAVFKNEIPNAPVLDWHAENVKVNDDDVPFYTE